MSRFLFLLLFLFTSVFILGCATKPNTYKASVEDLSIPHQKKALNQKASQRATQSSVSRRTVSAKTAAVKTRKDIYVVQKGDTLSGISEQLNLSYQDIADLNKLDDSFTIQPGQRLLLPVDRGASAKRQGSKGKLKNQKAQTPATHKSRNWIWPTQGKIVSAYQSNQNKGIDIGGTLNQSILAAAAGKVVYVGNDLIGYGKLIIISHSKGMMSAYAHNSKILVMEGDKVAKGEVIAEMGKTESGTVQLHFEIRKNGNPVNPVAYLPYKQQEK